MELVIVIIVIGILASISLRANFPVIERSRGAEAREILYKAYAGYRRLIIEEEVINSTNLLTWTRMGMSNPNTLARRYFNYTISSASSPNYINASTTRYGAMMGCSGPSATTWIAINLANGSITKSNNSPY